MNAIVIPYCVRTLYIGADGDESGQRAGYDCAQRLMRERPELRVKIARPEQGRDFNDMIQDKPLTISSGE